MNLANINEHRQLHQLKIEAMGLSPIQVKAFEARDYYHEDLKALFKTVDEENRPDVPSGLCSEIIDRCVTHLFPDDIKITTIDGLQDLLFQTLETTRLQEKTSFIATEGMTTGTVGVKTILDETLGVWVTDVYPVETLFIQHSPLNAENVEAITIRFRYQVNEGRRPAEYWHQERWSPTEYTVWIPQRAEMGRLPDFNERNIDTEASGANPYGEIPITIITHNPEVGSVYGRSEITDKLKRWSRELATHYSKIGTSNQLKETPAFKKINDSYNDQTKIRPGSVINLRSDGPNGADMLPLETPILDEQCFKHLENIRAVAFDHAQVTNPDTEREMKAGGTVSSVAWKAFNQAFVKKVRTLRKWYGEKGIEAHLEAVFRMMKRVNWNGAQSVNPDDPQTYKVTIQYPPFFEPTVDEKMGEISLLKQAYLPPEQLAQRIAGILEIDDEKVIKEIEAEIVKERSLSEPTILN